MAYFKDLREYLNTLESKGKLIRIKREINKDTELHPLVRLQFRGLPEKERKGFLFDNLTDSKGKKYDIPVVVGVLAASSDIYSLGMNCPLDKATEKWAEVVANPIQPVLVKDGPIHEEIHIGEGLLEHDGLEEFPIPISTPGYDPAPFMTSPYVISKDPETGIVNMGTYRIHIKSPTQAGVKFANVFQHGALHVEKARKMGKPLEAAIVIGGPPSLGHISVERLPYEVNELAYVGALAGDALEVVKCKTVDLEVPAYAEIVIEGIISTDEVEPEAPFGEALGYMGIREITPYFSVRCITHRKNPIFQSFISQFPPSESSMIRGIGTPGTLYEHLKYKCNQTWVLEAVTHESTGSYGINIIKVARTEQANVWKTLDETSKWLAVNSPNAKVTVAIDEDIDAHDADAVNWAICTRMLPHRDCRVDKAPGISLMDYSLINPEEIEKRGIYSEEMPVSSTLLLNATMKWPYPPVSLPNKEFMERALRIWEAENLPTLKLKHPWWGYNLGYWPDEWDEQAMMATKGDYKVVGEMLAKLRKKMA
ncbi:UbiD family decarboxylase [Chloroflexota bacterium]